MDKREENKDQRTFRSRRRRSLCPETAWTSSPSPAVARPSVQGHGLLSLNIMSPLLAAYRGNGVR